MYLLWSMTPENVLISLLNQAFGFFCKEHYFYPWVYTFQFFSWDSCFLFFTFVSLISTESTKVSVLSCLCQCVRKIIFQEQLCWCPPELFLSCSIKPLQKNFSLLPSPANIFIIFFFDLAHDTRCSISFFPNKFFYGV